MKKLFLILGFVLMSVIGFAQTTYRVTMTEMYTYDTDNEKWVLYQKQSNVNIPVVLEEEGFISFHAKSPSMYKFYGETGVKLSGESFTGYRYEGTDLKRNERCKIDIIKQNDDTYIISIIKSDKYNLRFYIVE